MPARAAAPSGTVGANSTFAQDPKKEVGRLLRALKRPHLLARNPIGQMLFEASSAPTAYDAVIALIGETFDARTVRGQRLLELLRLTDIEGDLPMVSVARQMGLSPRQYFRYRGEAVDALAERLESIFARRSSTTQAAQKLTTLLADVDPAAAMTVLGPSPDSNLQRLTAALAAGERVDPQDLAQWDPVQQAIGMIRISVDRFARGDRQEAQTILERLRYTPALAESQQAAFEFLCATYVRAVLYDSTDAAAQIAERACAAAESEEQKTRAMLTQLETAVRKGQNKIAESFLRLLEPIIVSSGGLRELSHFASVSAGVAFLNCDWAAAAATLRPAALALQHRMTDYFRLLTMANRIELAGGVELDLPGPADGWQSDDSFARLFYGFTQHRLSSAVDSKMLADDLDRAQAMGAGILVGYGLATQGLLGGEDAKACLIRAWVSLAAIGDAFVAHDAFVLRENNRYSCEDLIVDEVFLEEFRRVMLLRHPNHALIEGRDAKATSWWRGAIALALDSTPSPRQKCAGDESTDRSESLASDSARWLSVLLPFERRGAFGATLRDLITLGELT
ncbi:MAG TPA: hypothetical protein VFO29_09065 [Candidatus Rubrimentiphilum sp.]|nr:hypothetical protein [Candidatus Rubrimentiphilum sp.]